MKNKWLFAVMVPALLLWGGSTMAEMGGEVNFLLGQKMLDDDDWSPVEDQTQFGAGVDFGNVDWPVLIHFDVRQSSDDHPYTYDDGYGYTYSYNIDVDVLELNAGVMKPFRAGEKVQPFVTGGLSLIKADATLSFSSDFTSPSKQSSSGSISADDSAVGFYAGGGVLFRIGEKFNLGLDLRYSTADVEPRFDDISVDKQSESLELDAGGMHYGILVGFRW